MLQKITRSSQARLASVRALFSTGFHASVFVFAYPVRHTCSSIPFFRSRFKVMCARLVLVARIYHTIPVAECYANPDPATVELATEVRELAYLTDDYFYKQSLLFTFFIAPYFLVFGWVVGMPNTFGALRIMSSVTRAMFRVGGRRTQPLYAKAEQLESVVKHQNQVWSDSNAELIKYITDIQAKQSATEERRKLLEQKINSSWWQQLKTDIPQHAGRIWGWRVDHYAVHPIIYTSLPFIVIYVVWDVIPYLKAWNKAYSAYLEKNPGAEQEAARQGFIAARAVHEKFMENRFGRAPVDSTADTDKGPKTDKKVETVSDEKTASVKTTSQSK